MTASLVDADSLLAIDVGGVNTRAILFDVVEGRYRFLGAGTAPTTAGAPFNDIGEGVRLALDNLETIAGRKLIGPDQGLLMPANADGSGVDACVAVLSAGPTLKVAAVGLLEDVSVRSVQNLVSTTYAQVLETFSLNDRRRPAARLDALLRLRPDMVIIAGGTEGGASQSVLSLLESVGLACYLLPSEHRPEVLFAGNYALAEEVRSTLEGVAPLHFTPNIRPSLDMEQLAPAHAELARVFRQARARQLRGVQELNAWTNGRLMPAATAMGRTIRFISKEYSRTKKGVLGVDLGASATSVAAGFAGDLFLSVHPRLAMGENLPAILQACRLEDIARWVWLEVADSDIRDYLYNKASYPASLPVTPEELAIEHAIACQLIHLAVNRAMQGVPPSVGRSAQGLLPWFEPIIASGGVLTNAPARGHTLMILLNALQPTGVTTMALDQNNLAAVLGAAAEVNPLVTVQSLDSHNFLNLCTVISPVGTANHGTPILRLRITYSDGNEAHAEVRYGTIEVIPLPSGQAASLHLQPLHRFDVGMGGPGRGGSVKVRGGSLGVVVDARGRPLQLPPDPDRRRELLKKWAWTLGV